MKIAVSSAGGSIEAEVEPRFGRAPYYVVVDTSDMKFELVFNPNTLDVQGAGPQTAKLIADTGADTVLTGSVGSNAAQALEAAGIRVEQGVSGSVRNAIDSYLARAGR